MNMNSQYIPLYKTIILYLLKSSETPLSKAQIMDFMLESAYTSFLVLQEVFSELVEQRLVREEEDASRTYLFITRVGEDREHQGIQQVEEKLCSLRPSEEEFEEDIRQWVDPSLAHVPIDLFPGCLIQKKPFMMRF